MEYNTQRKKIVTKEYGRNVQQMIEYLLSIRDRDLRNQQARAVIRAMASLSNGSRKTADFWQKLWDEIFVISDFKLDIDSPFPIPERKVIEAKPKPIPYPKNKIRFPPYGKNIEVIIRRLAEEPDSPERTECTEQLAVQLKTLYLKYNRDSVSDELIKEHLRILSDGKLRLREDFVFPSAKYLLTKEGPDANITYVGKKKGNKITLAQQNNNPNQPKKSKKKRKHPKNPKPAL
ncbi:MAG: DUF4290 domain-containing protein [Bacteroidales bacterium]|jgi:hypothetical protein|nr:DUF4290 domain-containing protein [Bacteroidales bacterium]MBQ2488432.1 DUF4290 domain-containing protein [Bacteroidales bacterium]MBQ5533376.1 DUF4290 domain-containing protein [Bacteroidales bacterium]MBR5664399.1 DUF4290 domain-containing protein [Bacteroidales bacterium]